MASTPDPDELAALRREYGDSGLDDPDLAADPVAMFRHWMHDTVVAGLHEPNAMVVSTVSAQGHPSSRMVLLKGVDERGFVFYTNYDSRKGRELSANPHGRAALPVARPAAPGPRRGSGRAGLGGGERGVLRHPAARLPARRLGLAPVERGGLPRGAGDAVRARSRSASPTVDVPLPPNWGGYLVRPEVVEFWQGRRGRMHDRLVYRRDGEGWETVRLAP